MAYILTLNASLPPAIEQALQTLGTVLPPEQWSEAVTAPAVLVSTALTPVDKQVIETLPDTVGLIANIGVGTDNIDLKAATERGLSVSNTPVVTEDTADLTLALLLATCRQIPQADAKTRNGLWPLAEIGASATRVHGKTLGIIGFGAIGQAVARRAQAFGMKVIYHGPREKKDVQLPEPVSYKTSLDELLAEADIVSLHCPLSDKTQHLLDADSLLQLKPGAIVINTGRGALIDEEALVHALACGQVKAAGLDVYENEPAIHPELLKQPNTVLLPHIGSATVECRRDMVMSVMANIQAFLESGKANDVVV